MRDSDNFISSPQNSAIKDLKKLQQKKYRDKLGKFVVENPLTIRDGLKHGTVPSAVYVTEWFIERNKEVYEKITSQVGETAVFTVEEQALYSASSLEQPQGITAVYATPQEDIDTSQSVVLLLGVSDPGNVGAIIRSAAAFGIQQVVLDFDSADPYNPKVISAAKEAIFFAATARKESSYVGELHKKMPLIGLDIAGTKTVNDVEWPQTFCLVLGSEAHGIPDELAGHIDTFVSIPMASESVESLNVAASAAIALQRIYSFKK